MSEYYDPRQLRARRRQSALSVALEALGGGLVIAIIALGITRLLF